MKHPFILNIVGFLALGINVIWYRAKFFLRAKGYPVAWFHEHGRDFKNLKAASMESNQNADGITALRLLIALRVSVCILVAIAASALVVVFFGWQLP